MIAVIKKAKSDFGLRALSIAAKVSHHTLSNIIAGKPVSDRQLIAIDAAAAETRYPGIASHLRACGPCSEDFEGLLAAVVVADN